MERTGIRAVHPVLAVIHLLVFLAVCKTVPHQFLLGPVCFTELWAATLPSSSWSVRIPTDLFNTDFPPARVVPVGFISVNNLVALTLVQGAIFA